MCNGSQCSNHQPSTMTWHGRRLYKKKISGEPAERWLNTGKGEGNWEPKVGLSKLFSGLKMTQNVPEFKFRKEISNAHCTLGFIWHPQLKLPLGVFVFTSAKDIIEFGDYLQCYLFRSVISTSWKFLYWVLLGRILRMASVYWEGAMSTCFRVLK